MPCNSLVLEQLRNIRTLYFPDEHSYHTLLNQVADRNLKIVITMVHGVLVNFMKLDTTSTKPPRDSSNVKSPNPRSLNRSNLVTQRAKSPLSPVPAFIRAGKSKAKSPLLITKETRSKTPTLAARPANPVVQQQPDTPLYEDIEETEISPRKLREAISQSRAHIHDMISAKASEIESNLSILSAKRAQTPNGRQIDFGIIDELKRKRIIQK